MQRLGERNIPGGGNSKYEGPEGRRKNESKAWSWKKMGIRAGRRN